MPQLDPLIGDLDITILREDTEGFYPDRNVAWGASDVCAVAYCCRRAACREQATRGPCCPTDRHCFAHSPCPGTGSAPARRASHYCCCPPKSLALRSAQTPVYHRRRCRRTT